MSNFRLMTLNHETPSMNASWIPSSKCDNEKIWAFQKQIRNIARVDRKWCNSLLNIIENMRSVYRWLTQISKSSEVQFSLNPCGENDQLIVHFSFAKKSWAKRS